MSSSSASPGRVVTPDRASLPLAGVRLRVQAGGGMARVVCEQRFVNRAIEPLHATYSLPLPADAAVSGFAFRVGERRIVGEIDRKVSARERFEEAIAEGRTAALLDQERSSLFTQELGNVPPGAEVVAEVTLDQPLLWTDAGEWEWRFPTTVLPRYLGEPGRTADARAIAQDVVDGDLPVRTTLELSIDDAIAPRGPNAPAHALACRSEASSTFVELAAEDGARLDRDLVVRWPVERVDARITLETSRASAGKLADRTFGLLSVVPPQKTAETLARDLCVLIDTSGSMSGRPLEQARRVVLALIDGLSDRDSLELIEFSSRPRRWQKQPRPATDSARADARVWLAALTAGGSTEMADAILEALAPLRPAAQRQVVLVTDGAIGFETDVIAAIVQRLPKNCRLHTVGVGSAVNRSLTSPAARAGRGVEIVLGLEDDPERGADRLLRRTVAPVIVELEISGSALVEHVPARLPDLFAGAPVLVGLRLASEPGELIVRGMLGDGTRWERRIDVPATEPGTGNSALQAFFGRQSVEDLEMRLAAGEATREIETQIETLGLDHQICTRRTSWVAVGEDVCVDPSAPSRRVRMPHALPSGTSIDGLGLRAAMTAVPASASMMLRSPAPMAGALPLRPRAAMRGEPGRAEPPRAVSLRSAMGKVAEWFRAASTAEPPRRPEVGYDFEDLTSGSRDDVTGFDALPIEELDGAVQLVKERTLVIAVEIVQSDGFEWTPGKRAEIAWDSGELLEAKVVLERSTGVGHVQNGQTARVWLEVARDLPPGSPREVWLLDGDRRICIRIG